MIGRLRPFNRLKWAIDDRGRLGPEHGPGLTAGDELAQDEDDQDDPEDDHDRLEEPPKQITRSSPTTVPEDGRSERPAPDVRRSAGPRRARGSSSVRCHARRSAGCRR